MRANERAVLEAWDNSSRLRDRFIAEFIRDAVFLDLSGLVSGVQTVGLGREGGTTREVGRQSEGGGEYRSTALHEASGRRRGGGAGANVIVSLRH